MTVTMNKQPRGRFVFKKQNKIRWKMSPAIGNESLAPTINSTSLFVTGSWDDLANEVNLWSWGGDESCEVDGEAVAAAAEPELLAAFDHRFGDVNEIQFVNSDGFVAASSDGSATYVKIGRSAHSTDTGFQLTQANKWDKLHSKKGVRNSCNSVSCSGDHAVTVGSEGTAYLVNVGRQPPVRSLPSADGCGLTAVLFPRQDQVAAANGRGQVKLWDLRSSGSDAARLCNLSVDLVGVTCLARHPNQPHVLVAGGSDGSLAFWDLRGGQNYPLSLVKAHAGAISEVHFHDRQPDHLFTCSQNGDVWHWNGSKISKHSAAVAAADQQLNAVWLNSESVKNRVDTKAVMAQQPLPVNSISCLGSAMLVAGDSEAIYVIPEILL